MISIFFDTSVVVAHLRRRLNAFAHAGGDANVFISTTVLGELWHGFQKSSKSEKTKEALTKFLSQTAVLHPDESTAKHYGNLAAHLEHLGQKIPTNDIWIASIALEYGLPIATQDPHFQRVNGLDVFLW